MHIWKPIPSAAYAPPNELLIHDIFWTQPYHIALTGPWYSRTVLCDMEFSINKERTIYWQVPDPRMFTFSGRIEIPRRMREDDQWTLTATSHTPARCFSCQIERPPQRHGRVSMMTLAKYDAPYAAEWLVYHRALGIEHVYVYNNGSPELSAAIRPHVPDFVTEVDWPYPYCFYSADMEPYWNADSHVWAQPPAMVHAVLKYGVHWDWMVFTDMDEFLCPMQHGSLLPILYMADHRSFVEKMFQRPGYLHVSGKWFGTSGHREIPSGSVVQNYQRCERFATCGKKTIVRPDAVQHSAVHYWTGDGEAMHVPENVLRFNHYRSVSRDKKRTGKAFDGDYTNECTDTRALELARMHSLV